MSQYLLHDERNSSVKCVYSLLKYTTLHLREEMCRCIYYALLAACCFLVAREVDNNLQIYNQQICSRRRGELERVGRRNTTWYLLFYKLRRGLQHCTVAEYTRDAALSRLCSRDKPSLFTPTPGLARFAERVHFNLQKLMIRKDKYIRAHFCSHINCK